MSLGCLRAAGETKYLFIFDHVTPIKCSVVESAGAAAVSSGGGGREAVPRAANWVPGLADLPGEVRVTENRSIVL